MIIIVSARLVCCLLALIQCNFHTGPPSSLILITWLVDLLITVSAQSDHFLDVETTVEAKAWRIHEDTSVLFRRQDLINNI